MTDFDDYEDEMRRLSNLSDRDIDGLFAGKAPAANPEFDELAAHLRDAKTVWLESSAEAAGAAHVAAIAKTARRLAGEGRRLAARVPQTKAPSRPSRWKGAAAATAKVAAASLAASLSTVGLAYAGVDLPGTAAERAVEAVLGVHLPNQGPPEGAGKPADVGNAISEFASDLFIERGCTFGQQVAELARERGQGSDGEQRQRQDPCAAHAGESGRARDGRATGEERSGDGKDTAQRASSGGRATAEDASGGRSTAGSSTGDSASEGGKESNPTEYGKDTRDSASQSGDESNPTEYGKDTGDSTSDGGDESNPTEYGKDTGGSASDGGDEGNPTETGKP